MLTIQPRKVEEARSNQQIDHRTCGRHNEFYMQRREHGSKMLHREESHTNKYETAICELESLSARSKTVCHMTLGISLIG